MTPYALSHHLPTHTRSQQKTSTHHCTHHPQVHKTPTCHPHIRRAHGTRTAPPAPARPQSGFAGQWCPAATPPGCRPTTPRWCGAQAAAGPEVRRVSPCRPSTAAAPPGPAGRRTPAAWAVRRGGSRPGRGRRAGRRGGTAASGSTCLPGRGRCQRPAGPSPPRRRRQRRPPAQSTQTGDGGRTAANAQADRAQAQAQARSQHGTHKAEGLSPIRYTLRWTVGSHAVSTHLKCSRRSIRRGQRRDGSTTARVHAGDTPRRAAPLQTRTRMHTNVGAHKHTHKVGRPRERSVTHAAGTPRFSERYEKYRGRKRSHNKGRQEKWEG
jgi:hypothetical protein